MPFKRRNGGRGKKGRGHTAVVRCSNCGRCVSKDKAIKRYTVRDMVHSSSKRDILEALTYKQYIMPKLFLKLQYCVSCAVHAKVVRPRGRDDRKIRKLPPRLPRPAEKKKDATAVTEQK